MLLSSLAGLVEAFWRETDSEQHCWAKISLPESDQYSLYVTFISFRHPLSNNDGTLDQINLNLELVKRAPPSKPRVVFLWVPSSDERTEPALAVLDSFDAWKPKRLDDILNIFNQLGHQCSSYRSLQDAFTLSEAHHNFLKCYCHHHQRYSRWDIVGLSRREEIVAVSDASVFFCKRICTQVHKSLSNLLQDFLDTEPSCRAKLVEALAGNGQADLPWMTVGVFLRDHGLPMITHSFLNASVINARTAREQADHFLHRICQLPLSVSAFVDALRETGFINATKLILAAE